VLAEDSRELPPERGFSQVNGHWAMIGIAPAPRESWRENFDYLELWSTLGERDVPDSFGGASGGGLWHGLTYPGQDGVPKLQEVVLSGVIYYQGDRENGQRALYSHGRASLHERLADVIRKELSAGP
jgi:hypothetical protein